MSATNMAETRDAQKAVYPLPVYNFRVTLAGVAMSFSKVSGVGVEYETKSYRHGFSAWEGELIVRYSLQKYVPVTLRKGSVRNAPALNDWLKADARDPRPMEINLCDQEGVPVVTWRMLRVVPVKLEAPEFDAASNEVAVESLEVMAAGFSVEYH